MSRLRRELTAKKIRGHIQGKDDGEGGLHRKVHIAGVTGCVTCLRDTRYGFQVEISFASALQGRKQFVPIPAFDKMLFKDTRKSR